MKHIKYLLIYLIVILAPTAFCAEFNLNSYISATYSGNRSKYECYETYQYGSLSHCSFGTRYNGRMGSLKIFIHYPFEEETNYRLTFNMASDDFRNNFGSAWTWDCDNNTDITNMNSTVWTPTFISYKKAQLSFSLNDNTTCVGVLVRSANYSSDAFTGVNNWNLSNITIYDPDWQSGGSGQGTATPSPSTPDPNQQLIDNANQNTQDVIENNNSNTQQIIDNQNDLLTNKCTNLLNKNNYGFDDSNKIYFDLSNLETGKTYTISTNLPVYVYKFSLYNSYNAGSDVGPEIWTNGITQWTFVYDGKNRLFLNTTASDGNFNTSFSSLSNYNFMLVEGSSSKSFCEFGSSTSNKIDDVTNSINDTNDYLKDDSDPVISDDEFTSLFNSVSINNPLSSLLQLPVQFINAIVNQTNSCQVVNLGTLLGVPITLPCIDIGSILGSTVWNTIDVLSSIGLVVLILKQLYESITNALTLGGYMDAKRYGLGYMPPLEFLCSILTGWGGDI